jgi:diguanylate cyclase (GGDEF)-like protein
MTAYVGLAIQLVGILLIALLSLSVREMIKNASVRYWTAAWICLAISLVSLIGGFHPASPQKFFYSLYFFGEYVFGLLFVAGCRNYAQGTTISRRDLPVAILALLVATVLPFASADFNDLFMIHATTVAVLFGVSFFYLRPARKSQPQSPGLRVMSGALLLLALDFLHYVPVFGARKGLWGFTVPPAYLQYTSIVDLILEILLGFGTIMLSFEGVRREVEAANQELTLARDQLELMARMDPLTEALNRHAFHSLLARGEGGVEADADGCVAVLDIDNLKQINDRLGHTVGDKAIRSVASAVRSLIRADDMLFRWGGDEFLVLMFRLDELEARRRMQTLNEILARMAIEQSAALPVAFTVSVGVSGFASMKELGSAIERADQAMYSARRKSRNVRRVMPGVATSSQAGDSSRTSSESPQ